MTPVEAMNEVLLAVERETGKPVFVEPDPALNLHATLVMARGNAPLHVVRYRASVEPERPYIVSYQCGFILRAARTPPDVRFDLVATARGREEAERIVSEHFRRQVLRPRRAVPVRGVCGIHGLDRLRPRVPVGEAARLG